MAYSRPSGKKRGSKSKPQVVPTPKSKEHDDEGDNPELTKPFWHCADNAECAQAAWTWVDRLRQMHASEAIMDLVHEAVYRGRPIGANQTSVGRNYMLLRSGALINLNITMAMVDTLAAKLTTIRSMPMIGADDANYTQRRFAKRCSRVLRRKIGGTQISEQSPLVVRDMLIRGDGVYKGETFSGDVHHKRIPIYEIVVDPFETENGGARVMAHVRPEDRSVMMARYPKFEDAIANAPTYTRSEPWSTWAYQQQTASDYVEVRELWHLPSIPGAKDGCHVVTIKGVVVHRRKWRWPIFPVTRFQWTAPARGEAGDRGWRGGSLVEQLLGIQEQVNDILRDLREALKYGSQLTIFVQRGANVNKHHLRKRHPAVVEYDGVEPHYVAPNPVSEQAIRILLLLIDQAKQLSGLNDSSVSGQNPLGASASGKALTTMDDLQDRRYAHVETAVQQGRVRLGAVTAYLARDLYECASEHEDAEDEYAEGPEPLDEDDLASWIAGTDWSKLDLECGDYHLVLEPVNYLADAREGRLAQVAELGKNGLIPDPAIQADLFDEPDIQAANRIVLGPKHKIDMIMEGLSDPDIPMYELQPDQYTNLALGVLMAKGELNEAEASRKFDREDPELEVVCDRFRQWIELAKVELDKAKAGEQSVSPAGMMPTNMGPAQNALTLQPGLGAPPPVDPMGGGLPPIPAA